MNIPSNIIDKIRDQISLTELVSAKVSWDKKKTNPPKGDYWASCPFHSEKTASFHVDEKKGYFYCFGCHKKGDAITFKMESENLSFLEAVKILAEKSGIDLPSSGNFNLPDKSKPLMNIINESAKFFELELNSDVATPVRNYLASRNIDTSRREEFKLGYAPSGSNKLVKHLINKGFNKSDIIESGMALQSDSNSQLFDRFQNRLIFPITDIRQRIIAFGGRALSSKQNAKYLNSPETSVFNKGSNLYNFAKARSHFKEDSPLIVVEGYMDVISLSKNGFMSCVAPLGTAITIKQLELLWKVSPEPIIMMDGDEAGKRAINRLLEIIIPTLSFKKTARFCFLPKNMDPDDYVNKFGPEKLRELLTESRSLGECIWERETNGMIFDSPERISALNNRLRNIIDQISDKSLQTEFFNFFRKVKNEFFSGTKKENSNFLERTRKSKHFSKIGKKSLHRGIFRPTNETKDSSIAQKSLKLELGFDQLVQNLFELEGLIVGFITYNNSVTSQFVDKLEATDFDTKLLKEIKKEIIHIFRNNSSNYEIDNGVDLENQKGKLRKILNESSETAMEKKFQRLSEPELNNILNQLLEKQHRNKSLLDEFRDANEEIFGEPDESLTLRLKDAHETFQLFLNEMHSKQRNQNDRFKENSDLLKKFIDDKIWKKT